MSEWHNQFLYYLCLKNILTISMQRVADRNSFSGLFNKLTASVVHVLNMRHKSLIPLSEGTIF